MSGVLDTGARVERPNLDPGIVRRQAKAKAEHRYYLRDADGRYLHFAGGHLTSTKSEAWLGYRPQLEAVQRAFVAAAGLMAVEAPLPVKQIPLSRLR